MKHKAVKVIGSTKLAVCVSLADDCKNGHDDFSLTADIWEKAGNNRWFESGCGCCHDEIAKFFPALAAMFAPLHLSSADGVPMYAAENGFYWYEGSKGGLGSEHHAGTGSNAKSPEKCREILAEHLRATAADLAAIDAAEPRTKAEFAHVLETLGFRARWKAEADAGIAELERLTGEKYTPRENPTHQWEPLPAEVVAEIERRKASGYYSQEQVSSRDEQKRRERVAALLAKIDKELAGKIESAQDDALFDRACALAFGCSPYNVNLIYYQHTNTVGCNWNGMKKITPEEFAVLEKKLREHPLPEGLKFEWSDKR